MYARRDLNGNAAIELSERGLVVRGRQTCSWPGGRFDGASNTAMVLRGELDSPGGECPNDLPIKSFSYRDGLNEDPFLFIEVTRLQDSLVEVRYGRTPYYFSLRALPGDPWSSS